MCRISIRRRLSTSSCHSRCHNIISTSNLMCLSPTICNQTISQESVSTRTSDFTTLQMLVVSAMYRLPHNLGQGPRPPNSSSRSTSTQIRSTHRLLSREYPDLSRRILSNVTRPPEPWNVRHLTRTSSLSMRVLRWDASRITTQGW